jgi:hypothetical protein
MKTDLVCHHYSIKQRFPKSSGLAEFPLAYSHRVYGYLVQARVIYSKSSLVLNGK